MWDATSGAHSEGASNPRLTPLTTDHTSETTMFTLDATTTSRYAADRRLRLERVAGDRRMVLAARSLSARLRHGRDPATGLVALPATMPAARSDDRAATSWSSERVA
jgi:hypothetical protein